MGGLGGEMSEGSEAFRRDWVMGGVDAETSEGSEACRWIRATGILDDVVGVTSCPFRRGCAVIVVVVPVRERNLGGGA